jgi:hypothetical protein
MMRYRWFVDETKTTDEFGVPVSRAEYDEALHHKPVMYHRGELLAIAIALVILVYAWINEDQPLQFICIAFLLFELRSAVRYIMGPAGRSLSNGLLGFSLAMFIATLVWTFL